MGMVMCLSTVSSANLVRVLADPPLLWQLLAADDEEAYREARQAEAPGFLKRFFSRAPTVTEPEPLYLQVGEGESTDLDKAWHGIHYLLTQSDWAGEAPQNFLLAGGQEIGHMEVGYGPARGFTAEQVAEIAAWLEPVDEAWLRARFNPAEMMQKSIYPEIWDRAPAEDDVLGYCLEYFAELKRFVQQAARLQQGLLIYLS